MTRDNKAWTVAVVIWLAGAGRLGQIRAPDRGKRFYEESGARLSELAGNWVVCRLTGAVSFDRVVGYCEANGQDLGRAMVREGWAKHAPDFSSSYAKEERVARANNLGIWSTR